MDFRRLWLDDDFRKNVKTLGIVVAIVIVIAIIANLNFSSPIKDTVDDVGPKVVRVTSNNMDGTYTINQAIEIVLEFNEEQKKKFLFFVTGCDRLPIGGFKNLNPKLTVVMFKSELLKGGVMFKEDDHLPSCMTCQNYLKIPNYSSVEILREKLLCAISEGGNAFFLT